MSTTDLPGSSLLAGRYRLVERLGAGGMSVVWRGFDEVLGRQVAVKVLPPSTSTDPAFRRRLRAEAQAAARLSHPNITNVYDYGEATTVDGEPVPYVVMELIDGESLAAVLARVRKLPWQHAVRITAEVAAALAAAHSRGIVHRDVTPANVMLTATGAKVVDFGISALIGENDIDPDGSLLGTPAYLAPERLEGGQVSPATDVYAVGLLIYRTLIGQLPWDVGTTTALLRAHQYTEPEPLPPVDGLPDEVDALVGRCLEKRPDDRPSSAELAGTLAALALGAPATARGYVPDWSDGGEDTTILPSPQAYAEILGAGAAPVSPAAAPPAAKTPPAAAAAGAGAAAAAAGAAAAQAGEPEPVAPARNSRFGDLPSGPVYNAAPVSPAGSGGLRPAYGNQKDVPSESGRTTAPSWARISQTKTRRVLVVALGVLLLGVGTYGWSLTGANGGTAKGAPPAELPQTERCVVSYAVWSDKDNRFVAQVTVANRNQTPIKDWNLWFMMPGDQTVSGAGQIDLKQDSPTGGAITVNSEQQIGALKTASLKLSGKYVSSNNPPMAFRLNGEQCETFVSAKPGEPSRYVEHLANGQTRLSPNTSSPIPGITIGDGGVIDVTPTKPGTTTKPGNPGVVDPPKGTPEETEKPVETTPPVETTTPPDTTAPKPPDDTTAPPVTTPPATTEPPVTTQRPPDNPGVGTECDADVPEDCPSAP
ncbi:serine/threonine-protein kinase [Paractinoplanes lichenicola]|uniref:non-specific serine/threonine protein kinase n=1 Tax=Paractinoplanes lichenicola TaxID=2802976 RepID=A0ABS1W3U2_9ACTN|nr:serine/threonine-protein kinase [Actinoplanes lichenicola]MBL7261228.1 protein kinase [Actinoplanes lichenicola]